MAKHDLLFDMLKMSPPPERKGLWRRLFGKGEEERKELQPPPPPGVQEPAVAQAPPAEEEFEPPSAAPPQIRSAGVETPDTETELQSLVTAPRRLVVNSTTVTIAAAVLLFTFFCGYVVGHRFGRSAAVEERSREQLAAIMRQSEQPEVLEAPAPTSPPARRTEGTAPRVQPTGRSTEAEANKVVRKKGLNYLIIETFSSLDAAKSAQAFLESKGVRTTIEPKGREYELVSAVGFDYSTQRTEREAFQKEIQAYGRQYKPQAGTEGADFHSCYYRKW